MGGRDCYRKGYETGLWYEIKTIENEIAVKEALNKDVTKERELLESYRAYAKKTDYRSTRLTRDYYFDRRAN